MKNFRYLDCPDWQNIAIKLHDFIEKETSIPSTTEFWNHVDKEHLLECIPEIESYFISLGLNISHFAIIKMIDGHSTDIHIDWGAPSSRIQWPILNCSKSTTKLYKISKGKPRVDIIGKIPYWNLSDAEFEVVDEFNLSKPVVWRTSLPHCVFPENKETRYSLTCYFTTAPDHLLQ
jgi:hypothetical protein